MSSIYFASHLIIWIVIYFTLLYFFVCLIECMFCVFLISTFHLVQLTMQCNSNFLSNQNQNSKHGPLHWTFVWDLCIGPLHWTFAWDLCMGPLHDTFAWDLYMRPLHGTFTWDFYMGPFHGTFAWDVSMSILHGTFALALEEVTIG